MKLETSHYQLARHYQNPAWPSPCTLQPPEEWCVTVRAVLKLWLESDRGSQVHPYQSHLLDAAAFTFL